MQPLACQAITCHREETSMSDTESESYEQVAGRLDKISQEILENARRIRVKKNRSVAMAEWRQLAA